MQQSPCKLLRERAIYSQHTIVDDVKAADFLLFTDLSPQDNYAELRHHSLLKNYPAKSYVFEHGDLPLALWPGLYCSLERSAKPKNHYLGSPYILGFEERHEPEQTEQDLLFSFLGRPTTTIRKLLLNINYRRQDVIIRDTSDYYRWDESADHNEAHLRYRNVCLRSKFVLCPRGSGASSYRLFEMMQMGCVPVIISDAWLPPKTACWAEFSIQIPERHILFLPKILEAYSDKSAKMGLKARQVWLEHFSPEKQMDWLVDQLIHLQQSGVRGSAEHWGDVVRRNERKIAVRSHLRRSAINVLTAIGLRDKLKLMRP